MNYEYKTEKICKIIYKSKPQILPFNPNKSVTFNNGKYIEVSLTDISE